MQLFEEAVHAPVQWRIRHLATGSRVSERLSREITLSCDQRYDEYDMQRMVDVIHVARARRPLD